MRRVLLCLLTLPFALTLASAQAPAQTTQNQSHQGAPSSQSQQQVQQPLQTSNNCKATTPAGSYETLPSVTPSPTGQIEYADTKPTWLPIGNPDCHQRQFIFSIDNTLANGTCPGQSGAGPAIKVQLLRHGTNKPVKADLSYDIIPQSNGTRLNEYRVDMQSSKNLIGDYDLQVRVIGPALATQPASK